MPVIQSEIDVHGEAFAQNRQAMLTAIASFQEHGQEGVEFADPMPEDVPDPETLTSAKEIMEPYAEQS